MFVCLKTVIFLICGDEYVKVAHFVFLLEGVGVGGLGKAFRSICVLAGLVRLGVFIAVCCV